MRVAVTQFATTTNNQENLASCIRMISEAAQCRPSIIVLPEYCNTQPWYSDHNQAWDAALTTEGVFFQTIAEQAKRYNCYIVLTVTLRRDVARAHQESLVKSNISITSCLFSPKGEVIHQEDKQTLTKHERAFFKSSNNGKNQAVTSLGKIALLAGNECVNTETTRELALEGAQLLCHSMNSFSKDQSAINGPALAAENSFFLVQANKIGYLLPQAQRDDFSLIQGVNPDDINGIGQSQIVSACGQVLAKISNNKEGYTFADIDLTLSDSKKRPDGTDLHQQLRPELYHTLRSKLPRLTKQKQQDVLAEIPPSTVNVALFATYKSNEEAVEDVCHYIENNLSDIIQLPELFFLSDKTITHTPQQRAQIECLSEQIIQQISAQLRPFQYVCTSLVINNCHQAVLINEHGLFAEQKQLHFCQRYQWTTLGEHLNIIKLPLEQGNMHVAMLTADDAHIAEIVNIAALNNIHALLVPFDIQAPSEVNCSLLARAAENRMAVVAASREKNFTQEQPSPNEIQSSSNQKIAIKKNKSKQLKSTGLIVNVASNFSSSTSGKSLNFNGYIAPVSVKHQQGKITKALIHPVAKNKVLN